MAVTPVSIGVLGPRGLTGQELLRLLEKRSWAQSPVLISTQTNAPGSVLFRGKKIAVIAFPKFLAKPQTLRLLLSAAEASWAKLHLKKFFGAAEHIVDESSAFRMADDVPLIIPEINGGEISGGAPKLIASPNCTVAPLAMGAYPLSRLSPISRITVASYQSASGAGREGLEALSAETRALAKGKVKKSGTVFPHALADNLFPQIGSFTETGDTEEEKKTAAETRKIMSLNGVPVLATCVRVPVARVHSVAAWVELEQPVTLEAVLAQYRRSPGVQIRDPYPTPNMAYGKHETLVGRIRVQEEGRVVSFWACTDNLLKGAATNVVQIADLLVKQK